MKRILVFIGLKIAEVTGLFGIFAGLSYGHRFLSTRLIWLEPFAGFWVNGFVGSMLLVAVCGILLVTICGSIEIVRANWRWAKRILK